MARRKRREGRVDALYPTGRERASGRLRARLAVSAAPSRRDFTLLSNLVPDICLKYTILPLTASSAAFAIQCFWHSHMRQAQNQTRAVQSGGIGDAALPLCSVVRRNAFTVPCFARPRSAICRSFTSDATRARCPETPRS